MYYPQKNSIHTSHIVKLSSNQMFWKSVSFQKGLHFPLTGNESYRALKSSMSYVVFNIKIPFFCLFV